MAKPKQVDLPEMEGEGVAQPRFKDIDALADKYVDVRDKRTSWTEKEIAAKEALRNAMLEHSLETYRYDDHLVELKSGDYKLKVRNTDALGDADSD